MRLIVRLVCIDGVINTVLGKTMYNDKLLIHKIIPHLHLVCSPVSTPAPELV